MEIYNDKSIILISIGQDLSPSEYRIFEILHENRKAKLCLKLKSIAHLARVHYDTAKVLVRRLRDKGLIDYHSANNTWEARDLNLICPDYKRKLKFNIRNNQWWEKQDQKEHKAEQVEVTRARATPHSS